MDKKELMQAFLNGEQLQYSLESDRWYDWNPFLDEFISEMYYAPTRIRTKLKTVLINGIEVPHPVTETLKENTYYAYVSLGSNTMCLNNVWANSEVDCRLLLRGLIHTSDENAIAHAKALLSYSEKPE